MLSLTRYLFQLFQILASVDSCVFGSDMAWPASILSNAVMSSRMHRLSVTKSVVFRSLSANWLLIPRQEEQGELNPKVNTLQRR